MLKLLLYIFLLILFFNNCDFVILLVFWLFLYCCYYCYYYICKLHQFLFQIYFILVFYLILVKNFSVWIKSYFKKSTAGLRSPIACSFGLELHPIPVGSCDSHPSQHALNCWTMTISTHQEMYCIRVLWKSDVLYMRLVSWITIFLFLILTESWCTIGV